MEESQTVANAIYFGIGAVIVIGLWMWITDTPPGHGVPRWESVWRWIMLRYLVTDDDQAAQPDDIMDAIFEPERNDETPENGVDMPKDEGSEKFQFPDGFMALARMIHAGKLTESEALRLGIKAPAGGSTRYKEARRRLTAALNELAPDLYAPLTQAQIDNRHSLELPIKH